MTVVKYVPLEEANEYADDGEKLRSKLSDNGYLFFRDLLTKTATKARDDIVRILKRRGYVEQNADPAEPTWTGKTPDAAELTVLATGEANRKIGRLRSVGELSKAEEAVRVLERIVGGELFPWVENRDRVRVIGPSQPQKGAEDGGPRYATPAHQDAFHFRTRFVTMWTPLMEVDEALGGLALRRGSHKAGLREHWWRGEEYFGVAENSREAKAWSEAQAQVLAGTGGEDDTEKVWLHSDYRIGDFLIFDPHLVHVGLANVSDKYRISADFRYQRKGGPAPWQAQHWLFYVLAYLAEIRECVTERGVEQRLADKVWETMRMDGPRRGGRVRTLERVKEHVAAQV